MSRVDRVVFYKEYSDESMYDLPNDIADFFDEDVYHRLPEDDDGFKRGKFSVTITWFDGGMK